MDLKELKNSRVNQNSYIEEAMKQNQRKEKKKLGTSVDLTNKQMQHLQKESQNSTSLMRESLKQAGSQLLDKGDNHLVDKQDTWQTSFTGSAQKGKHEHRTKQRCRAVQQMLSQDNLKTEQDFDQFVHQNPSINYFLMKQLD